MGARNRHDELPRNKGFSSLQRIVPRRKAGFLSSAKEENYIEVCRWGNRGRGRKEQNEQAAWMLGRSLNGLGQGNPELWS